MYLITIFLPLISAFVVGFGSRFFTKKGAILISIFSIMTTMFLSYIIFYEVIICKSICIIKTFSWITLNFFEVNWSFLFDSLSVTMFIVVSTISTCVHIYSISYMSSDPHLPRFLAYLSIFTFFMLILISGDNFLQLFLGWEGVGLSSYLLINFWYTRIEANKAAMKALIINRIGDFGLLLAIALIYLTFGSLNFSIIFSCVPIFLTKTFILFNFFEINIITMICIFLMVGAVGKSAQIGLHTWLPDAMEGPTPVSALIHAATMVTAGVFVILRCSPLLEFSDSALFVGTILGSLTAFMAATIGVVQNDIKRVIAYSTCSQLGYMIFCAGLSNYSVSLFHLMNHAFFKALLFLSAGAVIHAMADEQDMRKYGGLLQIIPVTYILFIIGSLALMGFPFLTGFYSKDIILELAYGVYSSKFMFIYWLGCIAACCTSFYSIRLIYLTFLQKTNSAKNIITKVHEASWLMLIPMIFLGFCSIFWGYLLHDLYIGLGTDLWSNVFKVLPQHDHSYNSEFLKIKIKNYPLILSLLGAFFFLYIYNVFFEESIKFMKYKKYYSIYKFFNKKWFFDEIYNNFIVNKLMSFSYKITFKTIDRGFLEFKGPLGIVRFLKKISENLTMTIHTGLIYNYIYIMLLGIILELCLTSSYYIKYELLIITIYLLIKKKL